MTPLPKLRLAVFDCDGTLVDSQHSIIESMFAAFDGHGHPRPEPDAVRHVVGLPLGEAIHRLAPGADPGDLAVIEAGYVRAFRGLRELGAVTDTLYPGVLEALEGLMADGWLLGVATGKSSRGLLATLETHGIRDWFQTLQTADKGPGKPNPDMLIRAMGDTGAAADATVMVGDTTFDIEMARRAGTLAIGVSWGYHPEENLRGAGADAIIGAFDQLAGALKGLGGPFTC